MPSIMWARHTSGGNPGPFLSFFFTPSPCPSSPIPALTPHGSAPLLVICAPGPFQLPVTRGQSLARALKRAFHIAQALFLWAMGFPSLQPNFLLFEVARSSPHVAEHGEDVATPLRLCKARRELEGEGEWGKSPGGRGGEGMLALHLFTSALLLSFSACSCSAALGGRQTPQQGCNTQVLGLKSDDGTHAPHLEEIHTFAQLLPSGGRQHLSSRCSLRRNRDLTGVSQRRAAEYALHLGNGAFFEQNNPPLCL